MNLNKLIWDENTSYSDKITAVRHKLFEVEKSKSNNKLLTFDIYYNFPETLEFETPNNQWKYLKLAEQILQITKRWDKKYMIDVSLQESGTLFRRFFARTLSNSVFMSRNMGINTYNRELYTYKLFIIWADKLAANKLITHQKYNMFMNFLAERTKTIHERDKILYNTNNYGK